METSEILEYLAKQIDLLQRKALELSEQHDEIERQVRVYKELLRYYRGVYESEAGVGLQHKTPSELMKIVEEKRESKAPARKSGKKKMRRKK